MNIGEEIRRKRNKLKESQTAFGKRFGFSRNTIEELENGKRNHKLFALIDYVHDCKARKVGNFVITKKSRRFS
jgi:transcriptional regulator with XRE-family HTH domain